MLFLKIESKITSLKDVVISADRKIELQALVDYIQDKVSNNKNVNLNFICTHNSRRSHLSQIWAQVASHYFNIKNVYCYSGGTESTALFPVVASTLENVGFQIDKLSEGTNPIYSIKYSENEHPIVGFSKTYDNQFNPQNEFAALMTCSQADEGCPIVLGCEKRILVKYDDPKIFDNTPQQKEKYEERSNQIASEMLYVFFKIKLN